MTTAEFQTYGAVIFDPAGLKQTEKLLTGVDALKHRASKFCGFCTFGTFEFAKFAVLYDGNLTVAQFSTKVRFECGARIARAVE